MPRCGELHQSAVPARCSPRHAPPRLTDISVVSAVKALQVARTLAAVVAALRATRIWFQQGGPRQRAVRIR